MAKRISLKRNKVWQVIFADKGSWQCGVFIPKYTDVSQINIVERHKNMPELFMLLEGKVSLLLVANDGKRKIVELKEGKILIVNEWHEGFRPNGCMGKAFVVERDKFTTEYLDLIKKKIIKKVVVK